MRIRDRIRHLCRVKAAELRPNPRNWRAHPPAQQDAMRAILAEIGYAGALLARELPDGSLELIDGHLRAELAPEAEVPVLVLDLDPQEAAKLLALHDPLAGLAEADQQALGGLLAEVETESQALQAVLDQISAEYLARSAQCGEPGTEAAPPDRSPPEVAIPEVFQVVVECRDEAEQRGLFERLTAEGKKCRLLTL